MWRDHYGLVAMFGGAYEVVVEYIIANFFSVLKSYEILFAF